MASDAFTIPDRDEATYPNPQSIWFQTDIDALVAAIRGTETVRTGLEVAARAPAEMGVRVAAGTAVADDLPVTVIQTDLTIGSAASSTERIDCIVIDADGIAQVRAGTAAPHGAAKMPSLLATDVLIATVFVPRGATSIAAGNIVDKRVFTSASSGGGPATTDDLPEGTTNLYFTNGRADARALIVISGLGLTSDHGSLMGLADDDHTQYFTSGRADTWLATKTTTNLAEGANLYYTNARADARIGLADHGVLQGLGDDDHLQYHTDARALAWLGGRSTSDLAEGSNKYFTNQRVLDLNGSLDHGTLLGLADDDHAQYLTTGRADTWLATKSTTNLAEGANLYFTNGRADARIALADHGVLQGLLDDDHTQYLLLAGRGALQVIAAAITIGTYLRIGNASAPTNVTAGDATATRLMLGGDVAFGTATAGRTGGQFLYGTISLATTAAGATAATSFEIVLAPTGNSASEFRSLNFSLIASPSTGVTLATIEAGFFEVVIRSDAAITEADALVVRPYILDSSSPAIVGTIATVRGLYVRRFQRPSGTSTGAITSFRGIEFSTDGGSFITGLTSLTDILIQNPAASTVITTHVGLDIAALTRATTNIGIRNASNSRQAGYATYGAVTIPANVTDGDLTALRALVGIDTALAAGELLRINRSSYVPTNADEYTVNQTIIMAPGGTAGTNNRIGYRQQLLVRPTADDGNRYIGFGFDVQHDSGAFSLTHASTSMLGVNGTVTQAVGATTIGFAGAIRAAIAHSAGTITTGNVYEAIYNGAGGAAITTLRLYAITIGGFPTAITNIRGLEIPNLGDASVSNIASAITISAQSGALVGNFGIRNSSNLVQVQYARFGSLTVPANTTDGDVTVTRFSQGNGTLGTSGEFARFSGTLTSTAAAVDIFFGFQGTVTPASASSAEFRSLSMVVLNTAANTTNILTAGFFNVIHRSASAVTAIRAIEILAVDIDSSSANPSGTVTTTNAIRIRTFDADATNAVTLTTVNAIQLASESATGAANMTIGTWRGLYVQDRPAGLAALTLQIAIDIEAMTRGTTNIGIRNAAPTVLTPSAAQTLVAATAILANASVVQINSSGNVTSTAAPTVADGQDGQELTIVNVDTADTITLQDQGTLASSNLRLAANTVPLPPRSSIKLLYSATVGDWIQIGGVQVL